MKSRALINNGFSACISLLIFVLLTSPVIAQRGADSTGIVVENKGEDYFNSDTSSLRQVPPEVVTIYKESEDFQYANDAEYWKPKQRGSSEGFGQFLVSALSHPAAKIIFYLLILLAAIFIVYRLIVVNQVFYRSKPKVIKPVDDNKVLPEMHEVDSAIDKAIAAVDYRLAIRFLYLRTLYRLNARELIQFDPKITNQEYQHQMRTTPFHNDFTRLVHIYEYSWYGEFVLSDEQFKEAQKKFNHFTTRITY